MDSLAPDNLLGIAAMDKTTLVMVDIDKAVMMRADDESVINWVSSCRGGGKTRQGGALMILMLSLIHI